MKTVLSLALAAGHFTASLESLTGVLAEYAAFNGGVGAHRSRVASIPFTTKG